MLYVDCISIKLRGKKKKKKNTGLVDSWKFLKENGKPDEQGKISDGKDQWPLYKLLEEEVTTCSASK